MARLQIRAWTTSSSVAICQARHPPIRQSKALKPSTGTELACHERSPSVTLQAWVAAVFVAKVVNTGTSCSRMISTSSATRMVDGYRAVAGSVTGTSLLSFGARRTRALEPDHWPKVTARSSDMLVAFAAFSHASQLTRAVCDGKPRVMVRGGQIPRPQSACLVSEGLRR